LPHKKQVFAHIIKTISALYWNRRIKACGIWGFGFGFVEDSDLVGCGAVWLS